MNRTTIINGIIEARHYRRYLEVGVRNPADNFDRINAAERLGIDIAGGRNPDIIHQDSGAWFYGNRTRAPWYRQQFDLIFIDGDHREDGVRSDLNYALEILLPGGTIVMHDCRPRSAAAVVAEKPNTAAPWNGQAFRVYLEARTRPELDCWCVDTDHGMGIVRKVPNTDVLMLDELPGFAEYAEHQEWLRLIEPERFLARERLSV